MGEWEVTTAMSYLSLDQKGRATLPEEVRASLGLRPGDFVLLEKTERGTYELLPAVLVPRGQLWFHHPEMQRRMRKAEADVSEGRTKATRTIAEAQALLDGHKARRRSRRK
jgi:AbrB family looped-hinge helix DNA binding protein